MATSVTHSKVSAIPDGGDTNLVRPSDWNAAHVVTVDVADLDTSETATTKALHPDGAGGVEWQPVKFYTIVRVATTNDNNPGVIAVNSTSYIASGTLRFQFDGSYQPVTHFRIITRAQTSEASPATVTLQLATPAAPATPLSASGNDLVVTGNVNADNDSGWIAFATPLTADTYLQVALKGSNGTVDLTAQFIDVQFKYAP